VSATPAATIPFWAYEGRYLFVAGIDSVDLLGDFVMQAGDTGYFRTAGTRILRGRGFDAGDRAGSPPVVVVSEGMGEVLWPGRDPLGQCLRINADTAPCTTVIGVAEEARMNSLNRDHRYAYYVPLAQFGSSTGMVMVRVAGRADAQADAVRRALQPLMPGAAYVTAVPFHQMVDPQRRSWESGAVMFVAFGGLALVLAGIGLYSVIAYGVVQRRRDIGIRLALGASRTHVLGLVVRGGLRLVAIGIGLGSLIAVLSARRVAPLLFHESPTDPVVYAGVAVVLLCVALLATWVPASTAARLDPNITLRTD
jgi:hypothetical protein